MRRTTVGPLAASPDNTKAALARRSDAMTHAPLSRSTFRLLADEVVLRL